jgi:hypothetical protein
MSHPRYREYVPPMPRREARCLHGLSAAWEQAIVESSVDGLKRRALAVARTLTKWGRNREADDLVRQVSLLERVDDLHRHAGNLETLSGLYRALTAFSHDREPVIDDALVWAQTGALGDDTSLVRHGPAFRETAALRNRAFRLVASTLATYARGGGITRPSDR